MFGARKDDFGSLMDRAFEELERERPDRAADLVTDALAVAERDDGPVSERVHDALALLTEVILTGAAGAEDAEPVARRRLSVASQLWGGSDERTGAAMFSLASVLTMLDEVTEAERLLREALAIVEADIGDGPELATVAASLGALLASSGRFPEAEPLLVKALELDGRSPEPTGALSDAAIALGVGLRAEGRLEESRAVLQRAVAELERDPEADPYGLVMGLNQLSATLADLERLDEARGALARAVATAVITGAPAEVLAELYRNDAELLDEMRDDAAGAAWDRMLAQIERFEVHGAQEADLLHAYGESLYEREDSEGAEAVLRRAFELFEAEGDLREASVVLNRLAGALVDLGRLEEGEEAYRRTLSILERVGDGATDVGTFCRANLGSLLVDIDRAEEAVGVLEESVRSAEVVFADEPAARVTPYVQLGDALVGVGRIDDALPAYETALAAAAESGDLYTEDVASAMRGRALCLLVRGDVDEGVELIWQAVDLLETIAGEDGSALIMMTLFVGPASLSAYRPADVLRLVERSVAALPPDASPWVRVELALLHGAALGDLDRHGEAEQVLKQGLALLEAEEDVPDTVHFLRRMAATALIEQGRPEEALELLDASVQELGSQRGAEESRDLRGMLSSGMGRALVAMCRWTEAEPVLREALAIQERLEGPDSPELAWGLSRLAEALAGLGRDGEAAEVARRARALAEEIPLEDPDRAELIGRLRELP